MGKTSRKIAERLLKEAGVTINGSNPWDIQVKNEKVFDEVFSRGSLGFGEAYMAGWWDAEKLDEFFYKILSASLDRKLLSLLKFKDIKTALYLASSSLFNLSSKKRSFQVGKTHYDAGNDLFTHMLDSRLTYTCGYWKDAETLDQAQTAKLDLVCKKVGLKPGMKILDIGCGWGSFIKYASEKYGVTAVGITVSKEQADLARENCKGLPVEIRVEDYRDTRGTFDRIISLGMFEHVGYKNYQTYMKVVHKLLKDDGLFLLHTIGGNKSVHATDPWINKYIFPNSMLPSIKQIGESIEKIFVMEDWHNFGTDYDKTLMAWFENFENSWQHLSEKYDERFYRMWKYYLLSCAGLFRAREAQLWQIVLSKKGVRGGYSSIR
ncbi:Cyclopropane-fatty-acyl-phospholipid synthase [hydrothermal vent metagenome]|uniref:Cyclopropane-fatty-acyl-phospholipid synthase n=1 Tax=hydrothermal vent metagenome TaxID=652676 RepID=A0A3B0UP57_9ZZZZ